MIWQHDYRNLLFGLMHANIPAINSLYAVRDCAPRGSLSCHSCSLFALPVLHLVSLRARF